MFKCQVTFVTKIELCIRLFDYKHILQPYTKFSILIVTRFWESKFKLIISKSQWYQQQYNFHFSD